MIFSAIKLYYESSNRATLFGLPGCFLDCLNATAPFSYSAAKIASGAVRYAKLVSEKGGTLRVAYPAERFTVTVNGEPTALTAAGLARGIETAPGDEIVILPGERTSP